MIRLALVAAALVAAPGASRAAARPVLLASTPAAAATTLEALGRIRAELELAHIPVLVEEVDAADAAARLRRRMTETGAVGALLLAERRGASSVEVSAFDGDSGRTVIQEVDLERTPPANVARVLAVRAVEVLRAGLLRLGPDVSTAATPPPPVAADQAVRAWAGTGVEGASGPFSAVSVVVAGGILHSFEGPGVGPSFAPVLRASLRVPGIALRVTVVPASTGVDLSGPQGNASVRQELAAFEAVRWFGARALVPYASVGLGVLHVGVTGSARAPGVDARRGLWSAMAVVGSGAVLRVASRVALVAEAQLVLAQRAPRLRIGDTEVGRVGRATLLGGAGLQTWF